MEYFRICFDGVRLVYNSGIDLIFSNLAKGDEPATIKEIEALIPGFREDAAIRRIPFDFLKRAARRSKQDFNDWTYHGAEKPAKKYGFNFPAIEIVQDFRVEIVGGRCSVYLPAYHRPVEFSGVHIIAGQASSLEIRVEPEGDAPAFYLDFLTDEDEDMV